MKDGVRDVDAGEAGAEEGHVRHRALRAHVERLRLPKARLPSDDWRRRIGHVDHQEAAVAVGDVDAVAHGLDAVGVAGRC